MALFGDHFRNGDLMNSPICQQAGETCGGASVYENAVTEIFQLCIFPQVEKAFLSFFPLKNIEWFDSQMEPRQESKEDGS